MKKIIFLILIATLYTGCTSCTGGDPTNNPLQTGTKGLEMNFVESGLLDEVMEEDRLFATLEMQNAGYSDIKGGVLILSIEKDFMKVEDWRLPIGFQEESELIVNFDLTGKTISNQRGDKKIVRTLINTKKIDDTRNKIESRIAYSACYPYRSVLSDTICIDTDPASLSIAKKTCKASDIKSSSQGAPVVITKIEQTTIPSTSDDAVRLMLTITAEDRGNGQIIHPARYKDICLGTLIEKDDYGTLLLSGLQISDFDLNDGDFECIPNPMRESNEVYNTKCILKEGRSIPKSKFTFETQIVAEVAYGYKQTLSHEIDIINREAEFT